MSAAEGLIPFDLVAPARLAFPMASRACRVCSLDLPPYQPLRNLLPRAITDTHSALRQPEPDPHAACKDQTQAWQDMINEAAAEDDMVVAYQAVQEAEEAADRLWSAKLDALDVPEWLKESERDRRGVDGCYCKGCG